jgi:hypothetical protein
MRVDLGALLFGERPGSPLHGEIERGDAVNDEGLHIIHRA